MQVQRLELLNEEIKVHIMYEDIEVVHSIPRQAYEQWLQDTGKFSWEMNATVGGTVYAASHNCMSASEYWGEMEYNDTIATGDMHSYLSEPVQAAFLAISKRKAVIFSLINSDRDGFYESGIDYELDKLVIDAMVAHSFNK